MSRSLIPHSTQQAELTRVFRLIEDDLSSLRSMLKAFGAGPSRSAPSLGSVPSSSSGPGPRGPLSDTGIDGITGLRAALDGKASQEIASNDPSYAAYRTRFGTTVSQGSLEIREMVPALGGGRSVHVALGAWTAQAWTSDDFLPSDFAPAVHAHAISDTTGLLDALNARSPIDHTHTLASLGAAAASHQHGDADLTELSWSKLTGVPSTFTPSSHDHAFDSLTAKPTTLAGYGIVDAALASHTHDYSGVFASTSHGHPWADITSKPTAFPPEAHTHTTSDVTEGTNLYFAEARVRGTVLTGLNTSLTGAVSASDTILAAIGKLENRVSGFSAAGVSSFNTRTGAVTLTSGDVTGALGFSPSPDTHTHPASSITNTPAGNIASTTVQAALNELDSKKVTANVAIAGSTKTKITYDSKGLVTSGSDATATDIVNTPAGNISATTVQAAINELDSEKAQLAATLTNQRVPFANASGFLTDNANFYYVTGTGLRITDSTLATSKTSGALVVTGGIATGEGLYAGGRILGAAAASATGAIFAQPPATTLASGTIAAFRADLSANPASASSAINIGAFLVASTASGNAQDFTSSVGLNGFYMQVAHNGTGTVTGENGIVAIVDNANAGTVTDLAGARLAARNLGAGTITRACGVRVLSLSNLGGGTVGTNYGVFVEGQTAGTVNYSIYTNAGLVRLGGKTSIVDTTASTTTTSGALVVSGGVGIGGALYVGGLINSASTITGSSFSGAGTGLTGNAANLNTGSSDYSKTASCIGDGITRVFLWDGNPVYRTDWQGRQLLYSTARTNLCLQSQEFDSATWVKIQSGTASAPVVTANAGIAPDGTATADRVDLALNGGTGSSDLSTIQQAISGANGAVTNTVSVWLKTVDGSTKTVRLEYGSGNGALVTVTGTWQRFNASGTTAGTPTLIVRLRGHQSTSDSASLLVWGAQYEVGGAPTSYIPTTTTAVTVTDYATSGSIATLVSAPLIGSLLHGLDAAPTVLPGTYTVDTLPTAVAASHRAFVTDADATTFASIVAGGGANSVPVYHDGTNWRIG